MTDTDARRIERLKQTLEEETNYSERLKIRYEMATIRLRELLASGDYEKASGQSYVIASLHQSIVEYDEFLLNEER